MPALWVTNVPLEARMRASFSLTLRHAVSLFETGCRHGQAWAAHGRGGTPRVVCPGIVLALLCYQATHPEGSDLVPDYLISLVDIGS